MANCSGGKSTRSKGMDNNIYFTEPVADKMISQLVLEFPDKVRYILDACAGTGVLGEAIYNHYRKSGDCKTVIYQDIAYVEKADKRENGSILDYKPNYKFDLIICNPPFVPVDLALNIYNHLMSLLTNNGVLIFIINNTFLYQGWERARELKYSKTYFLPRYIFDTKRNKEKKRAREIEKLRESGASSFDIQNTKILDTILTDVSIMICPASYHMNNFIHIPREIVK